MNRIGFSTGCFHKLFTTEQTITYLRKEFNDIDCIEILFPAVEILNFNISLMNKHWLKKVHYKSLHYVDGITRRQYSDFIKEFGIQKVVIHDGMHEDACKIIKKEMILIENTEYSNRFIDTADYCLDVSHFVANKIQKPLYSMQFPKFRIQQFHLSNFTDKCHTVFDDRIGGEFMMLFKIIETSSAPVIIESVFDNEKQIKKEYNFIRRSLDEKNI